MKKRIYLDDVRTPLDPEWIVARNYNEFVAAIQIYGLENIELISLDHDLGDTAMLEYYNNVKENFSDFLNKNNMSNTYNTYKDQHVTANSPERLRFKNIFKQQLEQNSKYKQQIEWYFEKDYKLINSVKFYAR